MHCFFQVYLVDENLVFNLVVCVCVQNSFTCWNRIFGTCIRICCSFCTFNAFVYLSSGSQQQSSYEFNLNPLMHHFHWMLETLFVAVIVSSFFFLPILFIHSSKNCRQGQVRIFHSSCTIQPFFMLALTLDKANGITQLLQKCNPKGQFLIINGNMRLHAMRHHTRVRWVSKTWKMRIKWSIGSLEGTWQWVRYTFFNCFVLLFD